MLCYYRIRMMTLKCYATSGSISSVLFHSVLFCLFILFSSVEFHSVPLYYILFYSILFFYVLFYTEYSISLYSMFASVEVRVLSDPVTQTMPLPVLFFILFHSIFGTSVEA